MFFLLLMCIYKERGKKHRQLFTERSATAAGCSIPADLFSVSQACNAFLYFFITFRGFFSGQLAASYFFIYFFVCHN